MPFSWEECRKGITFWWTSKANVEPKSAQKKIGFCGGVTHKRGIVHTFQTNGQIGQTCLGPPKLSWPMAPRSINPSLVTRITCHIGTTSARPVIAPSSESQLGLSLSEPPRPYFHGSTLRSKRFGRKLLILSTSRTPTATRGAPSRNFKKRPLPALQ